MISLEAEPSSGSTSLAAEESECRKGAEARRYAVSILCFRTRLLATLSATVACWRAMSRERQFSANISAFGSGSTGSGTRTISANTFSGWTAAWIGRFLSRQQLRPSHLWVGALPGKTFIAFAASRPLKAAEKDPAGQWANGTGSSLGILLQGLQGAAVNQFGLVTAGSACRLATTSDPGMALDGRRLQGCGGCQRTRDSRKGREHSLRSGSRAAQI